MELQRCTRDYIPNLCLPALQIELIIGLAGSVDTPCIIGPSFLYSNEKLN